MNKNPFTYKKSGVDINAADKFINFISIFYLEKSLKFGFDFYLVNILNAGF